MDPLVFFLNTVHAWWMNFPNNDGKLNSIYGNDDREIISRNSDKNIKISQQGVDFDALVFEDHVIDLLVIILDNAIKYSPSKGNVTISVQKKSSEGDEHSFGRPGTIKAGYGPRFFKPFADHDAYGGGLSGLGEFSGDAQ